MLILRLEKYPALIALESKDEWWHEMQTLSFARCRFYDHLKQTDLSITAKEWIEEKIKFIETLQKKLWDLAKADYDDEKP